MINLKLWSLRFLAVLTAAALSSLALAQNESATTINLGNDTASSGDQASIPVVLNTPEGVKIGTTINSITFPNKLLSFVEATPSEYTEPVKATVTTTVESDKANPDLSILKVTITSPEKKPLPADVLANLVFKISEGVGDGEVITLKNSPEALTSDQPPQKVNPVGGRGGEITVFKTAPVVFPCFFYMH